MKRLTDQEKKQLGTIIHHYRNHYFHSHLTNKNDYKQINFCKGICSQAQLSRLENGDILKDNEIYKELLNKLHLKLEKLSPKDQLLFTTYYENIIKFQNDDALIINYNEYVMRINQFQNLFKDNIIYTHYNFALEFVILTIAEDYDEASTIIEDVESILDILPSSLMVLTLQYLGNYWSHEANYVKAIKFYLLSIEHMHKNRINNYIIYTDIASNYIKMSQKLYAIKYLELGLDYFRGTNHFLILERINRLYALIYLMEGYYEDCHVYLTNALKLVQGTNNKKRESRIYSLLSVLQYLIGRYDQAIHYIDQAIQLFDDEYYICLNLIINKKLNNLSQNKVFNDKHLECIKTLYFGVQDIEEYYENQITKIINEIRVELKALIVFEMYKYYKDNKKYKKSLDLVESFIL
jgi:tetratricopeptide (TPR) repeat protein